MYISSLCRFVLFTTSGRPLFSVIGSIMCLLICVSRFHVYDVDTKYFNLPVKVI